MWIGKDKFLNYTSRLALGKKWLGLPHGHLWTIDKFHQALLWHTHFGALESPDAVWGTVETCTVIFFVFQLYADVPMGLHYWFVKLVISVVKPLCTDPKLFKADASSALLDLLELLLVD